MHAMRRKRKGCQIPIYSEKGLRKFSDKSCTKFFFVASLDVKERREKNLKSISRPRNKK